MSSPPYVEPDNAGDGLTKLTVNLVPDAVVALNSAARRLGDSRTDTVNRALQVYAHATDLTPGEKLTFDNGEQPMTLVCTSTAWWLERLCLGAVLILLAFAAGMWSPW